MREIYLVLLFTKDTESEPLSLDDSELAPEDSETGSFLPLPPMISSVPPTIAPYLPPNWEIL